MLQVSQPAPSFSAMALVQGDFQERTLEDFQGKWLCLFFYPNDFTEICPTELIEFNAARERFANWNCAVVGISTDSVYSHLTWTRTDERLADLRYPLLSDTTHRIARDYGILLEDRGVTLRAAFLIDPDGILRYQVVHDLTVGRNIEEIFRVLSALQTGELCPAGWEQGKATLGKA